VETIKRIQVDHYEKSLVFWIRYTGTIKEYGETGYFTSTVGINEEIIGKYIES